MNEDDTNIEEDIEEQLETLRNSRDIDPSSLPQLGQTLPEDKETDVLSVSASHSVTENENQKSERVPLLFLLQSCFIVLWKIAIIYLDDAIIEQSCCHMIVHYYHYYYY